MRKEPLMLASALVATLPLAAWTKAQDVDLQTLLAIAAVAEADWSAADRSAQWHVHQRRAARDGLTLEQSLRSYVSMLRRHDSSPRAKWVMELTADCSRPADWDETAGKWEHYQARCSQLFEDATSFLAGSLADPCHGATQYGSPILPSDVLRARRAVKAGRWQLVVCKPKTVQSYFKEVR